MRITTLRKVGGSIIMTIPPALLEELHLAPGSTVGLEVDGERVIVTPTRPRYTLEELLAQCDPNAPVSDEECEWLHAPAAGREVL